MVRVVAAPHDALGTNQGGQCGKRALADLEADGALAVEVLLGAQLHVGAEAAEGLGLLVQALEPERGPPAAGLEEDRAQARVALQHAERDELGAGQHLLEGVGDGVQDQRVERAVRAERGHDHRASLVDPDGHIELLGHVPQRVVGAVAQRAAETGVGTHEPGHEAELGDGAAQFAAPPHRGPGGGGRPRRRGGGRPPRSRSPASRCRPGPVRRPRPGPRRRRSTARSSGRGRPGRCPRRPCRPVGPRGRTRRAAPRPAAGTSRGRRRSSLAAPASPRGRPGSRCRRPRRARSRRRPR